MIHSWLSIAHMGGYGIAANGWRWFIDNHLRREVAYGIRSFVMHLPLQAGSTLSKSNLFQFDALIHARESETLRAEMGKRLDTREFSDAFGKFIAEGYAVTSYIGGLRWSGDCYQTRYDDPDFAKLAKPGRWDEFQERVTESVRPILNTPGMGIGLDTCAQVNETHPLAHYARLWRSMGIPVLAEPMPFNWTAQTWHDFPCCVDDDAYPNSRARYQQYPQEKPKTVIRILNRYSTSANEERGRASSVLRDGDELALRVYGYGSVKGAADWGLRIEELN